MTRALDGKVALVTGAGGGIALATADAFAKAGASVIVADNEFERVMNINLRGVWNCMKGELRRMMAQGSGAIVNCSSIDVEGFNRTQRLFGEQARGDRSDAECGSRLCR